jgi:ribonuclease HIII
MTQPQNLYSCKLTEPQAARLETLLRQGNYEPYEVAYATCAGRQEGLNIVLYKSLKLVIQGKRTAEFIEFTLEPEVLQEARIGYEEELEPERHLPRIGVDESGKGDFFGPLCVAGVYANEAALRSWKDLGVQDSKNIKNDQQISLLAQKIRATQGVVYDVVAIGNEAYNRLHTKMKTVNLVLAWGHARVIENLLGKSLQMVPPPVKAISDQFAGTAATVERALMKLGRALPLVQMHKAESDLVVAAASILARDEFVRRLRKMGDQYQFTFPKGAVQVIGAGKEFVSKHGKEALPMVAKMHFRTSFQVLGLPVPERPKFSFNNKRNPS